MIEIDELITKNPWWQDPEANLGVDGFPTRDMYFEIKDNLNHSLILNLVGLRRVGKSVLIRQIAQHLLGSGIQPKNICYFLFDYASQLQTKEYLEELLRLYLKEILKMEIYDIQDRVYILLDEIQYIDNWQAVLKKFYDLSYSKIKFIITGSQSLLLANRDKESLAGRIFDFYLPPLSFKEFLLLTGNNIALPANLDFFNLEPFFSSVQSFDAFNGEKLYASACTYMIGGQFPATIQLPSADQRHAYIIDAVMGKVLDDCTKIFDIDKTDDFKLVAKYLLNNTGSLFEPTNIGREMGLTLLTVNKYIEYLRESHLFDLCYRYHKSPLKRGRLLKKLYASSVNFTCALNYYKEEDVDRFPEMFGKVAENLMYSTLAQLYQERDLNNSLCFWRKGKEEIDFLITGRDKATQKDKQMAIEVKFTTKLDTKELKPLVNYTGGQGLEYGIVITKKELAKKQLAGRVVYFIPFYLCLLAN